MTSVKVNFPDEEQHAVMLMGLLFREIRATFAAEDWSGLRMSHFRVVTSVPPAGISITDLGDRVGMTKQGCGQFVTQLVDSGHLRIDPDPDDRRIRLVTRTDLGRRTIAAFTSRNLRIEQGWAEQVGERRYRTFRTVLAELALESPDDA